MVAAGLDPDGEVICKRLWLLRRGVGQEVEAAREGAKPVAAFAGQGLDVQVIPQEAGSRHQGTELVAPPLLRRRDPSQHILLGREGPLAAVRYSISPAMVSQVTCERSKAFLEPEGRSAECLSVHMEARLLALVAT